MTEYFEQLILDELTAQHITEAEAENLRRVFNVLSEKDRLQIQDALQADPRLIGIMIDTIGKKTDAVTSGDMAQWKSVVDDEIQQLDKLE